MNIIDPPDIYKQYRCALHGVPDDDIREAQRKFYRANPGARDKIIQFLEWIYRARHEGTLPVERIQIRESDGKKHGRISRMMIYDIEYFEQENQIRERKVYIPIDPIYENPLWGKSYSFYNEGRKNGRHETHPDHSAIPAADMESDFGDEPLAEE